MAQRRDTLLINTGQLLGLRRGPDRLVLQRRIYRSSAQQPGCSRSTPGWVGVSKIGPGELVEVRGEGGRFSHRHLPNQTQLSCMCVCKVRGGERKDYGNTSGLAHSNGGKHCEDRACTTHSHSHTASASLLPFPLGPSSREGSQKRGAGLR